MSTNNYIQTFEIPALFDASNYEIIKKRVKNEPNFKVHNLEGKNRYWWAVLKSKMIFSTLILVGFMLGVIYLGGKGFIPAIGLSSLFFLMTYISFWNHVGFYKEQNLYYTTFKDKLLASENYQDFIKKMNFYVQKQYATKYLLIGLSLLLILIFGWIAWATMTQN
jgi:hypothetical protein